MIANKAYTKHLEHLRWCRNGQFPDAMFLNYATVRQNHAMSYRRKTFASFGDWDLLHTGLAATTTAYRFRCHTGYGATHMAFILGIGRAVGISTTGSDPIVKLTVTIAGGASTTVDVHAGLASTADDTPSAVGWRYPRVAVSANTTYEVEIVLVDHARVFSGCAYEIASAEVSGAVDFYNATEVGVGQPVYDATRQRLLEGMSKMWRKNGTHLFTYPGIGAGVGVDFSTTTWTNIIDGATTSTAATPGVYLDDLENKIRYSKSSIDVVLAVYASCTVSASGEVRFFDTTAAASRCSITGVGTAAAWYTTTTTISSLSTLSKLDIQARVSTAVGSPVMTLHAISLYSYLA